MSTALTQPILPSPPPGGSPSTADSAGIASTANRTSRAARAVEDCQSAWSGAYALALEKGLPEAKALRMASVAYKLKIPKMDSFASTKCAFSCIVHGISLEVFQGAEGSQLLYAAQVATTLYNRKGARK